MRNYPKQVLTIDQQVQSYIDAGMDIPSIDDAKKAMLEIGYYRLRGYCFQCYDNTSKKYAPGTNFQDVLNLYHFDMNLSYLLFGFLTSIEVALRVRLVQALLIRGDALAYMDPAAFEDKELYWQNLSTISSEIHRSKDVFIKHNFDNHEGEIPIWAAVEVMSFGTLSKTIKNLKSGANSPYAYLAQNYRYTSQQNGNSVVPTIKMFSSWTQSAVVLRNMCAHNARIYNRAINTRPQLVGKDKISPQPKYNGLYQVVLAMKYLRPDDDSWITFFGDLKALFIKYDGKFKIDRLNFPADWETHLTL